MPLIVTVNGFTIAIDENKRKITRIQTFANLFDDYFQANIETYPRRRFHCENGRSGDKVRFFKQIIRDAGIVSNKNVYDQISTGYKRYLENLKLELNIPKQGYKRKRTEI